MVEAAKAKRNGACDSLVVTMAFRHRGRRLDGRQPADDVAIAMLSDAEICFSNRGYSKNQI
jgi:hypothetical protein